jgi:hypothetical protein
VAPIARLNIYPWGYSSEDFQYSFKFIWGVLAMARISPVLGFKTMIVPEAAPYLSTDLERTCSTIAWISRLMVKTRLAPGGTDGVFEIK